MPDLTVAAAQPRTRPHDVAANALAHAAAVTEAGARVVVFPELSLTGYELAARPLRTDDAALRPLVEACAAAGAVALVGAPVGDGPYLGMLRVEAAGVTVVYRKTWLGGAEPDRFVAGPGPAVTDVDGWRLGLGICKDTGAARHVAGTAALGVDGYVAGLVDAPADRPEQDARGYVIARTCRAPVVFASFAGPTGGYPDTAGGSAIWSADGVLLARAGTAPGEVVRATLTRP